MRRGDVRERKRIEVECVSLARQSDVAENVTINTRTLRKPEKSCQPARYSEFLI